MGSGRRRRDILVGLALCTLPVLLGLLLLLAGVMGPDLTLVYASIAVSLVALPALVYGVILIVRAVSRGSDPA